MGAGGSQPAWGEGVWLGGWEALGLGVGGEVGGGASGGARCRGAFGGALSKISRSSFAADTHGRGRLGAGRLRRWRGLKTPAPATACGRPAGWMTTPQSTARRSPRPRFGEKKPQQWGPLLGRGKLDKKGWVTMPLMEGRQPPSYDQMEGQLGGCRPPAAALGGLLPRRLRALLRPCPGRRR